MTRQNRALPTGEIVALPFRGLFMGNRGCLHDDGGSIVRDWNYEMWITCVAERIWRDGERIRRELMRPRWYTELFFLDEPSSLAAGHRPCLECRNADGRRFRDLAGFATVGALDRQLMDERRTGTRGGRRALRRPRRHPLAPNAVPVGGMAVVGATVFARHPRGWIALRRDAPDLYLARLDAVPPADLAALRGGGSIDVLTPPTTLAALAAGYAPRWHDSAADAAVAYL